jgi:hypothetical protein
VKPLFLALTLVVLSMLVAAPALAQDNSTCTHDIPTIQALHDCVVECATMGHIDNQGVARSLLATLDVAQAAVQRGSPATAVKVLNAFIREVQAQSGKHIVAEHADHMVMHAQMVIAALSK